MMTPAWITNCPNAAKALNAADAAYAKAKLAAQGLNLADKIIALREAKAAKVRAYAEAVRS